MKKKLQIITLFSISLVLSLLFTTKAYACSTPTATNGIWTGSSSSLAGLIVHTKNNGTDFNTNVTISEGAANEGGIKLLNSSYSISSSYSSKSWNTGTTYYVSGQSSACSDSGYLWLGYGSSGSYGNKYALDCKTAGGSYFTYTITATPPSGAVAGGHWDYAVGGTTHSGDVSSRALAVGDNNITIQAANGYTGVVTFNWVPNHVPYPAHVSPANNSTLTAGTSSVDLVAKMTDSDADTVQMRVAYRQVNPNTNADITGWEYLPSSTTYTSLRAQNTNITVGTASGLAPGKYRWRAWGQDMHGADNPNGSDGYVSGYAGDWYFTIPVQSTSATLRSAVSPAGAATPNGDVTADTTSSSQTKKAGFTGVNSAYNPTPTWSGGCDSSGNYTFAARSTATVTCTATFTPISVVPSCVTPTLELISPNGTLLNPYITYSNSINLKARFTVPGYDSGSGGSVVMKIVYADNDPNNPANRAILSTSNSINLDPSGIVEYTIPTSQDLSKDNDPDTSGVFTLIDGHTYTWTASVTLSGAPTANGGASLCSVAGVVTINTPTPQFFVKSQATTCVVTPTSADRPPLTSSISVSDPVNGAKYSILITNSNNDVVLAKDDVAHTELPFYHTFTVAGGYTIKIDLTESPVGYVKPSTLPCTVNVTVDSGAGGNGGSGEVAPN